MKTHEHALISLGYAAGVAFLAGKGFTDPWIYVAAVAGGEIIDFVDHPLYHLVYRRNEPHVKETRKILREKGTKAAAAYLNEVEEDRQFKGLLLHNIVSLTIVALLSFLLSLFLHASVYWFVALGAFFLHMLTDVYGDFKKLGHADNWLWILSKRTLKWFSKLGRKLLSLVMVWGGFILVAFFTIGFRTSWQLANSEGYNGLLQGAFTAWKIWLAYIPLLGLSAYHLALLTLGNAAYYKYGLEIGRHRMKSSRHAIGSGKFLFSLISHKIPWTRRNAEIAILKMQADQGKWILFCAGLIVVLLTTFTFLKVDYDLMIVLTPIFLALLFGTFIHTTIGEFGGVLGVLIAWLLNMLLARFNLQPLWSVYRGYLVFAAAMGAWLLGLLGGMILKGQSRMSLVVFSLQLRNAASRNKTDEWIKDVLNICRDSLEVGYHLAHEQLFPSKPRANYVDQKTADLMVAPYLGNPILGTDYHHLEADDAYIPIFRELEYVLCENKLTSADSSHGRLLPVMPRYRSIGKNEEGDMFWENGAYHWNSKRRQLNLSSTASSLETAAKDKETWILLKTRSEILDHLVTKNSIIHTDIFVYPPTDKQDDIIVCGITREATSTKEYATVEAEAYAGSILEALKQHADECENVGIVEIASARLFYPRISYFDIELLKWAESSAVLPSDRAGFPRRDLAFLRQSLEAMPVKNLIPSATANIKKKFMVLFGEYVIATMVSLVNLDPNMAEAVKKIMEAMIK